MIVNSDPYFSSRHLCTFRPPFTLYYLINFIVYFVLVESSRSFFIHTNKLERKQTKSILICYFFLAKQIQFLYMFCYETVVNSVVTGQGVDKQKGLKFHEMDIADTPICKIEDK